MLQQNQNRTKIAILRCLSDGQWRTTPQVAQACGTSLTNASELLRRYRSQGLLNRERNPEVPRGYLYSVTDLGLARLHYLCPDIITTGLAMAEGIGLAGGKKQVFGRWVNQKLGR